MFLPQTTSFPSSNMATEIDVNLQLEFLLD